MKPIFVYGSLMKKAMYGAYEHFLKGNTEKEVSGTIQGKMHVVAKYPAVIEGEGEIVGELMYIKHQKYRAVLKSLDIFEEYMEGKPEKSMYLRKSKIVSTDLNEKVEAWVYIWNQSVEDLIKVEDGDWIKHSMVDF
ncbi:gamma-glutamylcyclotransferase family protein [Chengkuizengella sediminis]|uniref:gamma-glutamylcyclotransferase family protein n=1 Tax=Chengkuizengella sediminis TaxID=1885917 RepID=UPI00138A0C20|nr:gamma-glutamylcyclotransferase family protein [Chengkuizengella sediminis]NDI34118.1 gamma-glutamylcyclotransferase [Chengkuizengella sediminis]